MAWEPDKQVRTLQIEDHGIQDGKHIYRLSPFVHIQRGNGEVYLEPLPSLTAGHKLPAVYDFHAIELVPPAAAQYKDTGVQQLTAMCGGSFALGGNGKATVGATGIGTA